MKILQMRLLAFGPFSNTTLDLAQGHEGLHMVYGPNEAGKTSALRALNQMLFGIPERSSDDFLHPYAKIRIGGVLRHSDGTLIQFVRRKGRINTLRAEDDETLIPETFLSRFLPGIDSALFSTLFGIGHEDLVSGGKEILEGRGSLGQILFAAGAGISNLNKVLGGLQREAGDLYKPSAQNPRINLALSQYKYNQKALRETQLSGQEWWTHDQALQDALSRKTLAVRGLEQIQRERHRLERLSNALPLIARRREILQDLESCSDAPSLPEGFSRRRLDLMTKLRIQQSEEERLARDQLQCQEALKGLEVPSALLDQEGLIEQTHKDLGSYQKASKDQVHLVARMDVLRSNARLLLSGIRPGGTLEDTEGLHLEKAQVIRIQDLGARYERLTERLQNDRKKATKLRSNLAHLERQIQAIPATKDISALRRALSAARRFEALEEQHESERVGLLESEEEIARAIPQQGLWSGPMEALETLFTPSLETIDVFEVRFSETGSSLTRLRSEIEALEIRRLQVEGEIEKVRLEQEVPTEKDLQDARDLRDQGWRIIRRAWLMAEETGQEGRTFVALFSPFSDLPDAYESSVRRSDEVGDRLRREADRVAKKAALLGERDTLKAQRDLMNSRLETAERERQVLEEEWCNLWKAITEAPKSPREMRPWVQDLKSLSDKVLRLRQGKMRIEGLKGKIETHQQDVRTQLLALGEVPPVTETSLSDLILLTQEVVERHEGWQRERERFIRERGEKEHDLEDLNVGMSATEEELTQWKEQWEEALRPLSLHPEASPNQANAVIEDMKGLSEIMREIVTLGHRIQGIDKDAGAFHLRMKDLASRVAQDLQGLPVEQTAQDLHARLGHARTLKARAEDLEKQVRNHTEALDKARRKKIQLATELKGMCDLARVEGPEKLPEAEERSARRKGLDAEVQNLDAQMHALSGGSTIDEFIQEAQTIDADEIPGRISRLSEEIHAMAQEISAMDETIGKEKNELEKMDGSARAADLAEEAQRILGRLEADVEKYSLLRIACHVLTRAMERYREKNQGPILRRASAIFTHLCLGSYEGLRAEYNEQGEAFLVGVRSGTKEIVGVEGMSDGTADQLYLALRLASLENYLDKGEPMPFIVDDILIRFDNDRAVAALKVLTELARRIQVIFFTHHQHLLDLARTHVDPAILFEHRLA